MLLRLPFFAAAISRMSLLQKSVLSCGFALAIASALILPTTSAPLMLNPSVAVKNCITPLADPHSRKHKEWKELIEQDKEPRKLGKGAKQFLTLRAEDNIGDFINLDYYALTFHKPPNTSLKEFFSKIRQDFPQIVQGDLAFYSFRPYAGNSEDTLKTNRELWAKDFHVGAVMSFKLGGVALQSMGIQTLALYHKYGEVVSTCATPTNFTFSTVESDGGNKHPVAGLRGFGITDNGNGTWTFYSKASDRLSSFIPNHAARSVSFWMGDRFWDYFYYNLKAYLNKQGLKVEPNVIKNRPSPEKWPLTDLE